MLASMTPIFAEPGLMRALGLGPLGDDAAAAELGLRLLEEFRGQLSGEVLCFDEEPAAVERLARAGWAVVPCVTMNTSPALHLGRRPWVEPEQWEPPAWEREYLAYLRENLRRFPRVLVGNSGPELCDCGDGDRPVGRVMRRALARVDWLERGRVAVAPCDSSVERDARAGAGTATAEALREWRAHLYVFTGYTLLYPDMRSFVSAGMPPPKIAGEHGYLWQAAKPFPREHVRPYLRNLAGAHSGVGYIQGARLGHRRRLSALGFTDLVFFVPMHEGGREMMRLYLSDPDPPAPGPGPAGRFHPRLRGRGG